MSCLQVFNYLAGLCIALCIRACLTMTFQRKFRGKTDLQLRRDWVPSLRLARLSVMSPTSCDAGEVTSKGILQLKSSGSRKNFEDRTSSMLRVSVLHVPVQFKHCPSLCFEAFQPLSDSKTGLRNCWCSSQRVFVDLKGNSSQQLFWQKSHRNKRRKSLSHVSMKHFIKQFLLSCL